MKVLLYADHHHLPFWGGQEQSTLLFDPVVLATWVVQKWTPGHHLTSDGCSTSHAWRPDPKAPSATENYMWPILCGLHALDLPFLAHVSSPFMGGQVKSLKRAWVQFSNAPDQEIDGVPQCIVEGKAIVSCLWGRDNETYSPYDFLKVTEVLPEHKTPDFWSSFFLGVLQEARQKQTQIVDKLVEQLGESRRLLIMYHPLMYK